MSSHSLGRNRADPRFVIQVILLALAFVVYLVSPVSDLGMDPKYSMLVSESILRNHTPALNGFHIPGLDPAALPSHPNLVHNDARFYQLGRINGRIVYLFPNAGSILSLPFVAALDALGVSVARSDGTYDVLGEWHVQRFIAALLMAVMAAVLFRTACLILPNSWSLVLALAAAFGTQMWSTATRALWSGTWEIFIGGWLVLALVKAERERAAPNPMLLATMVAWMYFVRPLGAIVVVAVTIFVSLAHRENLIAYIVTGLGWAAAFLLYSWKIFGELMPEYYRQDAFFRNNFFSALAANIASPSRGLLVFVPATAVVMFLVARHWRGLRHRGLAVMALGIIATHVAVVSSYAKWWGGWSYGPRLLMDLVPWFMLLAILGCRAMLDYCAGREARAGRRYRRAVVVAGGILIALGIAINANGALNWQTEQWNDRVHVEKHPAVVWSWRKAQFLAGL